MRASHNTRRLVSLCLLLFPLSALTLGCSREGTVSGTVSYKGERLNRGTVTFFPEKGSGTYQSVIGNDGTYSISKLPPGPAKVAVSVPAAGIPPGVIRGRAADKIEKALKKGEAGGDKAAGGDKPAEPKSKSGSPIPDKYANPDKSGLSLEVTGGKQVFDIKLD